LHLKKTDEARRRMLSNEALLKKIQCLDDVEKAIVQCFIESSLKRRELSLSRQKEILLQTSVWDEESIQHIESVQEDINQWPIPTL
jgi:hypothetical protein